LHGALDICRKLQYEHVFGVEGMEAVYPASYVPHIGVQDLLSRVSNEVIVADAKALHSTLGHQFDPLQQLRAGAGPTPR
jgi:hypothetical protein